MAIDFDNSTQGSLTGFESSPLTVNHTPVGTPAAILMEFCSQDSADPVTSVTYGGETMTLVGDSSKSSGEPASVVHYELLAPATIPTGAQDCVVNFTGVNRKLVTVISLTAGDDVTRVDFDNTINSDSLANPSVTLSLGGVLCWCGIAWGSGVGSVGGVTELTNWTNRGEIDFIPATAGCYTYDTLGTSDVTAGYTASADDANMVAFAYREAAGGGGSIIPLIMHHRSMMQ